MQEFGVDPTVLTGNLDANEEDKIFDVSFLGRDFHTRQDIHMLIIMEHQKDKIRKLIQEKIYEKFTRRKPTKWWEKIGCLKRLVEHIRTLNRTETYLNQHPIDTYVD